MIYVRTLPYSPNTFARTLNVACTGNATLNVSFSEKDILKFQALLNRGLNCAPEFGKDWFELSARLDEFVLGTKTTSASL
jgi:hypothetical protein